MAKATTGVMGVMVLAAGLMAQAPAGKAKPPAKGKNAPAAAAAAQPQTIPLDGVMVAQAPPPNTTVVEDIVARVNDKVITNVDLEKAQADLATGLQQEAQQTGQPVSAADIASQQKDLLANLIDDQLLIQRASDLGMSAETETVLELDQLRQQNHLASMEDLQKAVESEGQNYADFEQQIRNQILQKKVIEEDVAPRVAQATPAQIAAYYNAHKQDFMRGDEVGLSEIMISTQGKTDAEKKRLKELADQVQQRAAAGEDFGKLAQRYSNSASASSGGDIGFQKKSLLEASLAKTLFALPVGGVSPVQNTDNGYLILKVTGIHHAGLESLQDASADVSYTLYQQMLRPELQTYLANLRQQAYITVKTGYVDTGATPNSGPDITHFQRVLPSDLPKQDKKSGSNSSGVQMSGGGGGGGN